MNVKPITFQLVLAAAFFFAMAMPLQADAKSEIYKNWPGVLN